MFGLTHGDQLPRISFGFCVAAGEIEDNRATGHRLPKGHRERRIRFTEDWHSLAYLAERFLAFPGFRPESRPRHLCRRGSCMIRPKIPESKLVLFAGEIPRRDVVLLP